MRFPAGLNLLVTLAIVSQLQPTIADEGIVEKILENARTRAIIAAKDREALGANRAILQKELERVREVRDWAVRGFDDPLSPDGTRFPNRSVKVARWHELRGAVVSHLVNLPVSESTGRIWSGNGLNALKECLGPAALQHEMFLRQMAMIPESSRTAEDKERLELLQSMSRDLAIPPDLLSNIQCSQGLTGQLLPIKLAFGEKLDMQILPLDWPAFFRTEPEFKKYLDAVAKAKTDCIDAAGKGDFEPSRRLMKVVDELDQRITSVQKSHILGQTTRSSQDSIAAIGTRTREIQLAKNFVKTLRFAVARFIEMDSFPKAEEYLIEELKLSSGDQHVSVMTILAAMEERGLRFAKATRTSETAHQVIFERMRGYYAALYGLSLAVKEQQQDLRDVDRLIAQSHRTEQLGMIFDAAALWMTRPHKPPDITIVVPQSTTTTTTTTTTK